MFGFYRVASAVPKIKVANVKYNTEEIVRLSLSADKENASLILFPELSLTGYTCGDLFLQSRLKESVLKGLKETLQATASINIAIILGFPLEYNNSIYNCAALLQRGKILGIVPKTNIPNYREFYEKRWFSPSYALTDAAEIPLMGENIPFGSSLVFEYNEEFKVGVEICEDLWGPIPQSSFHAIAGATIIANPSASNELVGKSEYRKSLVMSQSARCMCGYIYSSSGVGESSSDVLYSGHAIIAENGVLNVENSRFALDSEIIYTEIDCQRLSSTRKSESSFYDTLLNINGFSSKIKNYRRIKLATLNSPSDIKKKINPLPFVPSEPEPKTRRCTEIFNIQSSALSKRLSHLNAKKSVVGISGGLDSTLALLVVKAAHEKLKKPLSDIIAITMPGFGTTDHTYNNALALCKSIGCDSRINDIKEICELQFKILDLDKGKLNTTYENVQARQRTMILMNTANETGGIVIGTGDLSEIALGWSTYNADHMSMYSVNCGVPKTLIRYLIEWYASTADDKLKNILLDIIDTPVSPELLPPQKSGEITQKTEDIIGPYELHDFFLYHSIKYGASPEKIRFLAGLAFKEKYDALTIEKYLRVFIHRFFSQQFKRNCIPDGPKVGTIALSPRGDWRMPPDASYEEWLN